MRALHNPTCLPLSPRGPCTTGAGIALAMALALGLPGGAAQAELRPTEFNLWPHWEGRMGLVVSEAGAPLGNPFALHGAPTASGVGGLRLQSAHLLGDYTIGSGFRTTVGLVRGNTAVPFQEPAADGGLSVGARLLDPERAAHEHQTVPYVGAGYSAKLDGQPSGAGTWRFNADLGIISLNSQNIGRIGRVFQGEAGVDDLVREMRLRPVIKFTVKYSF